MKRIIALLFVVSLLIPASASAVTVTLLGYGNNNACPPGTPFCAGITSQRVDWAELAEVEDVFTDPRISAGGSFSIFDVSPPAPDDPWNEGIWVLSTLGYVEVAFNNPSDSLFVQFESDSNDGMANFIIDGTPEYSLNTNNGSWFAVVFSDLTNIAHTIRVEATSTSYPNHLAIDVIGSGAPGQEEIPEPATMLLLGCGLAGAAFRRRRLNR